MPELTVDGRRVSVPDGATLLDAARRLGIAVPTLCHRDGLAPHASCMVCLVEDERTGRFVPSCATEASEGDRVRTTGGRLAAARRRSLDLLLAEHEGDCEAPCTRACPAHPDIPGVIRRLAAGDPRGALALLVERLPLAATLAEICPAPCEQSCRRRRVDTAIGIRGLKRAAAAAGLAGDDPYTPRRRSPSGRRVAVVGGGPAGLAAAYALAVDGHGCVVFERAARVGGAMPVGERTLDADVAVLGRLGVEIRTGHEVTAAPDGFDAVVIATGSPAASAASAASADDPRVVACGNARFAEPTRLAVRSVADGIAAAHSVSTLLGSPPAPPRRFDSRRRTVTEQDLATFARRAAAKAGGTRRDGPAVAEALRCLDCDCAKGRTCRLRAAADALGGDRLRYAAAGGGARADGRAVEIAAASTGLSLETGKCIRCGTCVRIAAAAGDRPGLAFSGRGPDLKVRVPFGDPLEGALPTSAAACVAACPTGALAWDAGGRKEHAP